MEQTTADAGPWILETRHLGRVVAGKALVDDVNLQVRRGEILAVVGPSGSGKSSFLRLINRLDEPTAGTVLLDGTDYRTIPPRELRRRVGLVTQTAVLFPGTVADNIRFGPDAQGRQFADGEIELLLDQVGLSGHVAPDDDAGHLSGGEAQRVSLARALANSPRVLLLDEPTSALDDSAKRGIEALILTVVRQHSLTCLMVTHDVAQAARMGTRVAMFRNAKVERTGSAKEVFLAETRIHG
jgi:ABC-type proline/glycine betaine transport system ATPase subunit